MAIFKCKMCGGTLEINGNETTTECEYCGTKQTLPRLDDERKANLYDRANHFRRNNEFDKAMSIYENILNEDTSDAEAYWSLVLCRYGIEYVEDPVSHKRIPTVNRAQFTSVFDDINYKSAMKYADITQKSIYEAEANIINDIQKGILEISRKEEPFDVFICYKESDANGRRTPDSVLANDLYHQLVNEGYKVFFSRITLEDKLGIAYEPYIFAALNSAKVMVVLGTKPEYFNAIWVKNEWSRYLSLVKESNGKKLLIPAYKDMDPYDLPEEFSHLQAQDMSKLGFMQDLIRGIKKIAASEGSKKEVVQENRGVNSAVSVAPLLKRAFMYLEDEDWEAADEYAEKVLDQDPENAEAYLAKLMAELCVYKQESLRDEAEPFDDNNNYQKVLRFANDKLKNTIIGYIEHINIRNEKERLERLYKQAKSNMLSSKTEKAYKQVAEVFDSIRTYKDSAILANECYEKAEVERKEAIWSNGISRMASGVIADYVKAIKQFEAISGWRDADEQIKICKQKIKEVEAREEAERLERVRKAEIARVEEERKKKRIKKIVSITIPIVCCIIIFIILLILLNTVIIPNGKYNEAINLMETGKYEEAISVFVELEGYKDSKEQIEKCETAIMEEKYNAALALMYEEKYTEAISAFENLGDYKDSKTQIQNCKIAILESKYNDAVALINDNKTIEAYEALIALNGYKDSAEKASSIYNEYKVEKLKSAEVGDYVFFGAYEQDNNIFNGKEDIEWLVLDKKDGKLLVVSKNLLDCQPYNTSCTYVTWETCSLRKWLNIDFVSYAFSEAEKNMIPVVTVSADKNPGYGTDPGNSTLDKVFLLSIVEADKYFDSSSARQCKVTAYAKEHGVYVSASNGNGWWWLRSPGDERNRAAEVDNSGFIGKIDREVDWGICGVRPALWIELNP